MITGGRGRTGGLRRGQRGLVSVRVLLALAVSTVVTVAVSGPMAFQAYQANSDDPSSDTTTTTPSTTARPSVLSETTLPGRDSVALGGTTEVPATTDGTGTTTPGSGGSTVTTVPRRTTAPTPATSAAPGPRPTTAGPAPTTIPPGTSTVVEPPGTTTTTTVPVPGDGIVFALSAGQRDLRPLPGAVVSGRVWIYFEGTGVDLVRFWIDNPSGTGSPANTEEQSPYTLVRGPTNGQPGSWDSTTVANGQHSVLTEVVTTTGSSYRRLAVFTVSNIDD